jgi:hypothetical protein
MSAEADKLRALLTEAADAAGAVLDAFDELLTDAGGCDHGVGICMCADVVKSENLHAALRRIRAALDVPAAGAEGDA